MRNISEIKPFEHEFELFTLPAVRIIGKEARCGGALGNTAPALAEETLKPDIWNVLLQLPLVLKDGLGWTCDYDKQTDTFSYLVCVMTPAGTAVPDGFAYRDIPETICAKGLFGEDVPKTIERAKELGYVTNWEPYGWNAELYIEEEEENPPKTGCDTCHWLVPVRKA
jgi:predicted transcriptional regulator YdeE